MRKQRFFAVSAALFFLGYCLACANPLFAQPNDPGYSLSNAPKEGESPLVILQDGRSLNPFTYVPEGWIVRDDGTLLTDEGAVLHKDGRIEFPLGTLPEGYRKRADGTIVTSDGLVLAPKGTVVREKVRNIPKYPKGTRLLPDGTLLLPDGTRIEKNGTIQKRETKQNIQRKETVVVPQSQQELWTMLPLQNVGSEKKKVEKPKEVAKAEEKPAQGAKEEKGKKENVRKEDVRKEDVRKKEEKAARKPKIGEELSIPPDAAKTGNLSFLEGCWQGTRPEYYSKRTIYECFCFGKNAGYGKRRVIDPRGHRRCVGGSSARLEPDNVLFVSSQGAVCSDGEKWGQAEMRCKGRGNHTPCSWFFRDAQGGRQAYSIPFVRVESCGRR